VFIETGGVICYRVVFIETGGVMCYRAVFIETGGVICYRVRMLLANLLRVSNL
jgi:hypothetical protein